MFDVVVIVARETLLVNPRQEWPSLPLSLRLPPGLADYLEVTIACS